MSDNPYVPKLAEVISIKEEVGGVRPIKTFRMKFTGNHGFTHQCGQCAMISIFGKGEAMISISSSPLEKDYLQFSILKSGRVTSALHDLKVGDLVGLRGPYGNTFPIDKYISLIYGSRSSADLVYREEFESMRDRMSIQLSVDGEEEGWDGYVGFVPSNLLDKSPSPKNAVAVTCGPPIMIKFVIANLKQLGFEDGQIYTTVENKMKCGIGKCGRCNIGKHYVCVHGPVYSWADLKKLPLDY
jgi:NAD(P)H-flavin reductase